MIEHPNNTTQEKVWLHFYIPVILYMTILAWIPDVSAAEVSTDRVPYTIVDTAQIRCYSNNAEIEFPKADADFFGQDAQYAGNEPVYKDNGDGTVTDLNTGLMWQSDPGEKMTFKQAVAGATTCRVGGYDDWRLPTIKELYSLILFSGTDPDPRSQNSSRQRPFIGTKYFKFRYGNPDHGERIIDSQFATCTKYVSTTMRGNETMFGVNFADGRIKGYPIGSTQARREKTYYVMYVRGNNDYGKNDFKDNGDGTVTDNATGLMWMKVDSGKLKAGKNKDGKMNWQEALDWAQNLEYAGYSDWRLPNVKELQSIVDYTRSPATTNSAALDPVFQATSFIAESGKMDYPFYWTSTTHASLSRASTAAYVAFGRSFGWMRNRRTEQYTLMDVHGAGSQRSDPKSGDASRFPRGRGPQGDVIRIYNFVRCVRGGTATPRTTGPKVEMKQAPRRRRFDGQPDGILGPGMGPGRGGKSGMRQGRGPSGDDFVRRLDRNGDGKVSKSEFDGPVQHFSHLDRNGDGYLSAEEAPQGPPQGRNGRGSPGEPGGGNFVERVMDPDKNSNGEVIKDDMAKQFFKVFPVGTVEKKARTTCLKIADKYAKALKGLDGFSHVVVLYWFHKNDTPSKRSILQTRLERFPNKPLAGVFASRAPMRPNLIALSTCRILSVEGNTVRVASIDAFDGTPILDLKLHIPNLDSPTNARLPDWWRPGGFGGPFGQGQGAQGRGGPGGPGGGDFVERVMGFDKNGDGKVTKDEMPERMKQRLLQRADTNGDGALDKKEVKKFAEQMGQGGGGRGRGGPGTMGRGQPSRGGPGGSGLGIQN